LSKIRLKHEEDGYLKFVLQDPVGMFCYFILKLVDPKLTKQIEDEVKAKHVRNTHYERSNWREDDNVV